MKIWCIFRQTLKISHFRQLPAAVLVTLAIAGMSVGESQGQSLDFSLVLSCADGEAKKSDCLIGPLDPVAFVFGFTYRSDESRLSTAVPQSHVPPVYGTSVSVAGANTVFQLTRSKATDVRVGMRFWSILEGGVLFQESDTGGYKTTMPADNPYSGEYQTFWGGYGYGDYAAIGKMEVKSPAVGWYVQVQTPDINLTRHIALQPFAFISMRKSEISFESGYHRYASAFNPGYEYIEVGTLEEIPARVGLLIRYTFDENFSVGLVGYAERDLGGISETSQGAPFDLQYKKSGKVNPGGGLQVQFRF
jgi:hypothetical protein